MKNLQKLTAVLFAAIFAFGTGQVATAQSGGMGGHGAGMTREDPIPFTRDMEKVAADILSQMKNNRIMDARNSMTRLSGATDKVMPHITDAALKTRLSGAVDEVKTIVNARSPDLFALEDAVDALQTVIEEARKKLQGME
jgi:hypothetical protein